MRPRFNSFHHQPQQSSSGGNQGTSNMNMLMMQPQMGIFNINSNPSVMPLLNNVGFMNGANQQFYTPSNNLGFPHFGPILPNPNNLSIIQQLPAQFSNPLHNPNQPNWLNFPQQSNIGLTNGQPPPPPPQQQQQQQQLFLQNQLQNLSRLLNVQLPHLSQLVSGGQAMGCLNPTAVQNPHFGFMQPNPMQQQTLSDVNASNLSSAAASQVQGDPSLRKPMSGPGKNGQNVNKFSGRNAKRDAKLGFQKSKFQQPRFHQADNAKRTFASSNGHKKKGRDNERASYFPHPDSANPAKEKRRSLDLTYTEQEIRQWREERKKFYPTKANIKKKLSRKVANTEVAKLRSEQLKEILAKQAELGVEVAEIPTHYLLGSEKKVVREENHRLSTKRGRFGTRNDKRGKLDKRDRFSKKWRPTEESFDGSSFNKRSPTLLQKLLSADIRKDKSRLLQVFRFMAMNSFFKDWPEKPLKFPVVIVKDGASEGEIIEEKPLLGGEDNIEICNNKMTQCIVDATGDDDFENNNDNEDDDKNHGTKVASYIQEKREKIARNAEEEEEIID
ncbi:Region-like protein isoform 2 [Hibiscus syriacus]|uniref:Region-like protein isoform 2 n=1 Tax=Hibiscus syriacus TaxID=106335 RepID=A0A6A2Z5D7_HIBSY|nr:uncharacterized protein LOC120151757 isoform X2 [Hibiscus syriacus]KAE8686295.1 Region-like protein isoform 2 [Hibiscus syriacus]